VNRAKCFRHVSFAADAACYRSLDGMWQRLHPAVQQRPLSLMSVTVKERWTGVMGVARAALAGALADHHRGKP